MQNKKILPGIILTILLLVILTMNLSAFKVRETEQAIVLRFGKPVGNPIVDAGLKFKVPFLDNVLYFDKRILEYDSAARETITKDKKTIKIDNYAKWKIEKPLLFLQTVASVEGGQSKLDEIVYSVLREEIGKYDLIEIISDKREKIMHITTETSKLRLKKFGINLIDVRMKKAELPKENEDNIYNRMRTEREQQAKKYRAEGSKAALEITSEADKLRAFTIAEAQKKAAIIRGEGDAKALQIYADAYNKGKSFYKFMRKLEAQEKIFKNGSKTKLILTTDSEVFDLLKGIK